MTIATFAGRLTRIFGFGTPASGQNYQRKSSVICDPAETVWTQPKRDGAAQPNWKARALMLHNRNGKAASAYERIHTILSEGRK